MAVFRPLLVGGSSTAPPEKHHADVPWRRVSWESDVFFDKSGREGIVLFHNNEICITYISPANQKSPPTSSRPGPLPRTYPTHRLLVVPHLLQRIQEHMVMGGTNGMDRSIFSQTKYFPSTQFSTKLSEEPSAVEFLEKIHRNWLPSSKYILMYQV